MVSSSSHKKYKPADNFFMMSLENFSFGSVGLMIGSTISIT